MQESTRPAGPAEQGSKTKPRATLRLDENLHIVGCKDPACVLGIAPPLEGRHLSALLPEYGCLTRRECIANFASLELPRVAELPAEVERLSLELSLSEQRFRLLFESNPLPLWIYDRESFAIMAVNDAAAGMYGYTRAELTALRVHDLWLPEQAAELEREVTRPRSAGFFRVGVRTRVRKDGGQVRAEIHTHDLIFKGRPARLVVASDITLQQRTERMLIRSGRALEMLAANTDLAAVFGELCAGIEEQAGSGCQCAVLLPDNGRIRVAAAPGMAPGLAAMLHGRMLWTGGESIGLEAFGNDPVIVGNIEDDPRCAELRPLLRSLGIAAGWSLPVRMSSGAVAGALTVFLDRAGEPSKADLEYGARVAQIAGIAIDHHAADDEVRRLNAELEERVRQRTAQLEEANRELESFSYTIAHDLRAPLRAIEGYSTLLLTDHAERLDPESLEHARRIVGVGRRMAGMIDALLDLSRLGRVELRRDEVNLSDIAAAIAEELRSADGTQETEFHVASGLVVRADRSLMTVVMQNLLANAWKFTRQTPSARIEFGAGEEDRMRFFYVRDNGAGFDMEFAGRLFEPFERLHRVEDYEGSGIGLATVRRAILRHGGRVWAESRPGAGATFYFTI